jgi:hypothetical protein
MFLKAAIAPHFYVEKHRAHLSCCSVQQPDQLSSDCLSVLHLFLCQFLPLCLFPFINPPLCHAAELLWAQSFCSLSYSLF